MKEFLANYGKHGARFLVATLTQTLNLTDPLNS